jgi:tRNA G18 (ribose-2'-O)-methylase SpoU
MTKILERNETRKERYYKKLASAQHIPLSIATVNFHCDENLAFIIRTAACFGVKDIHVIGSIPPRNILHNSSGSLVDFIPMKQYSTPAQFLNYAREMDIELVSAELAADATSLYEYEFNFSKQTIIVLGNETTGVPNEILFNSDVVYIPMIGSGWCLNTSQTGTAFVSEYLRQIKVRDLL